jgi:type VI protein secretion system component VasK
MVAAPIAAIGLMWPKPTDADALLQVAFWTAVVAATRWVRLRRGDRQLGSDMSATSARP